MWLSAGLPAAVTLLLELKLFTPVFCLVNLTSLLCLMDLVPGPWINWSAPVRRLRAQQAHATHVKVSVIVMLQHC